VRTRRQRLGQHFLHDGRTARAIVAALADAPPRVLEIGPGRGALTRPLLERFPQVRVVEMDGRLAAALPQRLGNPGSLEILHADALTVDLDRLAEGGSWQLAANLPYSVGTPILRRLLPRGDLFTVLVVMVQWEVARRLVAPPGSRERGLLSVEVEAHARAELLLSVPPHCFSPPPRVSSGLVRFVLHPAPAAAATLRRALGLAAAAFAHRRKKLANALASTARPDEIATALTAAGATGNVRPQELELAHWLALAEALPAGESA
jgi:16S rRNA (adenine1518-N6/adenine1519-N6)-dimethyltransferase